MRKLTVFFVSALCSQMLLAEPAMQASASIDQSGQSFQGNLMFNQAAGDAQQQANARAIAAGQHAKAQTSVNQINDQSANVTGINANASIDGSSFARSLGIVGVNQGAGSGNQQINAMRIASGSPQGVDDSVLAQQSVSPASLSGATEPQSGGRVVSIDDAAFGNSRGVVQLNQSAGVGNRSINSLGIRISE